MAVAPSIVNSPVMSLPRPTAVTFTPASTSSTRYPNSEAVVGAQAPSKPSTAGAATGSSAGAVVATCAVTSGADSVAASAAIVLSTRASLRSPESSLSGESLMTLA